MKKFRSYFLLVTFHFTLVLCSSCFLLGVHIKVKNPKHAGKYPKFSESTKLLGSLNKYRDCFDATFYELNIAVDHKNKYLKGKVTMLATALSDFDTLQIDLYENMQVKKIQMGNRDSGEDDPLRTPNPELLYYRKYGAVFVKMSRTMKKGEDFSITVDYEGKPKPAAKPPWKGGFVWKKDKNKNPWIGVACESDGASLWWPCKDVTNDEPDSAAINITVPKDLMAVSNGHLTGTETNGDFSTYQWRVSYPINLYNITLYVGKFKLLSDSYKMPSSKTLLINHYVLPINYEKAKVHLEQVKGQIAFFEKTFGEYPWYKDGYKLVESPYAGMEHQSAIAYGNSYKNSYNGFDYIILHESAHEWWGNSVSAADLADVWIQEGFATYSEALYVESIKGKEAYLNYLLLYRLFINNKRPVVGPIGARFFDYKDSDVYMKGAWILHTLRTIINNDELFFDILKTFYETYKMKTVSSRNFIGMVNEKTGADYNWFFNQYLYKREAPMLEHYWDGTDFFYRWKHTDASFNMQIELALDGVVKINLKPTNKVQKIAISSQSYKEITFNNYTQLFGTIENKKIKKILF